MASWNVGGGDAEGSAEAEGAVEVEEPAASNSEMDPDADVDPEAKPLFMDDDPSDSMARPLGVITSVFDAEGNLLPMTTTSSPPRASTSVAVGSSSPPVLNPLNVVVTASFDDDMEEDHVFHLADEHGLFQQVKDVVEDVAAEEPQQQSRPRRGVAARRGGAERRGGGGRGRGRGGARRLTGSGGSQWVRGERLVEVDDDDVPERLRYEIMNIVNAREAARARLINRERRAREENEEEWLDADDGEVESFFAAEGTSNQFDWSPMGDYQGAREQFLP